MANFNKVYLMGNLTRDPELKYTQGGMAIVEFGLAMNRKYRKQNNEMVEETTFVDIEGWGKQAETFSQYMSKGRPAFVEGRLKLDTWESNGQKRSKLRVVMENFQFIGGRDESSRSSGGGYQSDSRGEGSSSRGGDSRGGAPVHSRGGSSEGPSGAGNAGGGNSSGGSGDYDFDDIPF